MSSNLSLLSDPQKSRLEKYFLKKDQTNTILSRKVPRGSPGTSSRDGHSLLRELSVQQGQRRSGQRGSLKRGQRAGSGRRAGLGSVLPPTSRRPPPPASAAATPSRGGGAPCSAPRVLLSGAARGLAAARSPAPRPRSLPAGRRRRCRRRAAPGRRPPPLGERGRSPSSAWRRGRSRPRGPPRGRGRVAVAAFLAASPAPLSRPSPGPDPSPGPGGRRDAALTNPPGTTRRRTPRPWLAVQARGRRGSELRVGDGPPTGDPEKRKRRKRGKKRRKKRKRKKNSSVRLCHWACSVRRALPRAGSARRVL
jgi:hypothetical protein